MPKDEQYSFWPDALNPPSTPQLEGLNQRLTAYRDMHAVGPHIYAGDRLVATFHESLLGRSTMMDLQLLLCVAPDLLRNFI